MVKSCSILLAVTVLVLLSSCQKTDSSKNSPAGKNVKTDVIIAHGGGSIDGYTYPNSLEALNLSYSKGCRLFELDIIETSDGTYVAAHDWVSYKSITDYEGVVDTTPLSEEEFLLLKVYGKYTPLNMDLINRWFTIHPDAILVTDKVNEPAKFAKQLRFKSRTIMELFSWVAVEEALAEGITPMISDNLVFGVPDIEQRIEDMGISHLAISRRYIDKNKDFLKGLKDKGVKTYVFHVNFDEGKDEMYVINNELDYVHGLYADNVDVINRIR